MKPNPIGIYARGVAMGAADIVPGVSGGTVALITGIYARLLGALVKIDKQAIAFFFSGRWRALWHRLDGPFLGWLLAGILTAIFSLASVIHWLLLHYPQPLWSFFQASFSSVARYCCAARSRWIDGAVWASLPWVLRWR